MSVRAAVPGDAVALAALMTELGYPSSGDQVLERLAALSGQSHLVLVGEKDGEVVGAIHLHRADTLASGPIAEILAFIVHDEARGRGYGRALIDSGVEWAETTGAKEIRVRARVCRDLTHAFYQDQGFTLSKQQFVFVRPLGAK